jgi:hypothetical protein
MPLLSQILLPVNDDIKLKMAELTPLLVAALFAGTKTHQIFHLATLRLFMQNYLTDPAIINWLLLPRAAELADYIWKNKGADSIRVSGFLSLFLPLRFTPLLVEMVPKPQHR